MAIEAGQIIHDANGTVVDRIQSGGVSNLNISEEKVYELDWSADGRHVVLSSTHECQCSRIWRVGADGSDLRTLTNGNDLQPTWRPEA